MAHWALKPRVKVPCLSTLQASFNKRSIQAVAQEFSQAVLDHFDEYEEEQMDTSPSIIPTAMLAQAHHLSSVLSEVELHEAILAEVELQQPQQQAPQRWATSTGTSDLMDGDDDQVAVHVLGSSGSTQLQVSRVVAGICAAGTLGPAVGSCAPSVDFAVRSQTLPDLGLLSVHGLHCLPSVHLLPLLFSPP